jgi:hypothetical protein
MVDYMNLEEQVDVDFDRARRRAFFGSLKTRFVGGARPSALFRRGQESTRGR